MSPIRCTSCFFLFFELLVASCEGQTGPRSTIAPAGIELEQLVDSLRIDPGSIRFVVDKSERAFRVMGRVGTHERELRVFPCVLGENAVGDKFHQGDRRTPEGVFTFRSKRVHNEWHKFIWVDYPQRRKLAALQGAQAHRCNTTGEGHRRRDRHTRCSRWNGPLDHHGRGLDLRMHRAAQCGCGCNLPLRACGKYHHHHRTLMDHGAMGSGNNSS